MEWRSIWGEGEEFKRGHPDGRDLGDKEAICLWPPVQELQELIHLTIDRWKILLLSSLQSMLNY